MAASPSVAMEKVPHVELVLVASLTLERGHLSGI